MGAQDRIRDLESVFHRSEMELAAALSDKRALENDVAELRAQLAKVASAVLGAGPAHAPWVSKVILGPRGAPTAADRVTSFLSCVSRQRTVMRWPKSSLRRRR